jgi:hypothetical protein
MPLINRSRAIVQLSPARGFPTTAFGNDCFRGAHRISLQGFIGAFGFELHLSERHPRENGDPLAAIYFRSVKAPVDSRFRGNDDA